jgi:preprotein translocase subunit YajC
VTSALTFAADSKSSSGSLGLIFPLLLVAMVGFLFYSTRKRKAAAQSMTNSLKVGSRIMTTAGLFATVVAIEEDGVVLEVAPGVHSKYARQAVSRVIESPEDDPIEHEAIHDSDYDTDYDSDYESGRPDKSIDLNKEPPTAA